jgi:hypothetical protein
MPLLYKGHTIVAGASRSQSGQNFIPVAYIAWELTPKERGTHAMISGTRWRTFEEASENAFAEAKAWVDRHSVEVD